MGLQHSFVLVREPLREYDKHLREPAALHVHDDVMQYMADSLAWIATENPALPDEPPRHGLRWHGVTAIRGDAARQLAEILAHWAALFACGPTVLVLTGAYTWVEGEPPEKGSFLRLELARDELVATLRQVSALASQAAAPGPWLLHVGI